VSELFSGGRPIRGSKTKQTLGPPCASLGSGFRLKSLPFRWQWSVVIGLSLAQIHYQDSPSTTEQIGP
jgi:hypothetical protein